MSEKWRVVVVLLFAVIFAAVGETLAAKGMKGATETVGPDGGLGAQLRAAFGDWHVWAGLALMGGYVLLYCYTLGLADLSFALPLSASSYLLGALLARYYLHEDMKPARVIGTAVIMVGVLIVGIGGASGSTNEEKQQSGGGAK